MVVTARSVFIGIEFDATPVRVFTIFVPEILAPGEGARFVVPRFPTGGVVTCC